MPKKLAANAISICAVSANLAFINFPVPVYAQVSENKGLDHIALPNANQKVAECQKRVEEAEKFGKYSKEYRNKLLDLARAYAQDNQIQSAISMYDRVIYLSMNDDGPMHQELGLLYEEYGQFLSKHGYAEKAAEANKKSAEITAARQSTPVSKSNQFIYFMQRGAQQFKAKNMEAAQQYIEKAVEATPTLSEKIIAMGVLADICAIRGNEPRARTILLEVKNAMEKANMTSNIDYGNSYRALADLDSSKGDLSAAENNYLQAIKFLNSAKTSNESQADSKLLFLAMSRMGLSKLYKAQNKLAQAQEQEKLAKDLIEEHNSP